MNRRQVLAAGGVGFASLAGALGARGQQPEPTASVIQTQIAQLQATLTSIAAPPDGTPAGPAEFEFTGTAGKDYEGTFRVRVGRLRPVTESLYDNVYDKPLEPRGRFVVLDLTLTNIGTDPVNLWEYFGFRLRDDQGRRFSPDSDASRVLERERDVVTFVFQPDLPYPALLVWDVALDADNFTLEVEGTDVSLPLSG